MPHVPSLGSIDYAGYSEHVCWGCGCSQCRCMNSKRTTSNSPVFDVIVVGAGASATAYQLFKNGAKRVLLLEQEREDSGIAEGRKRMRGDYIIIHNKQLSPQLNCKWKIW